MRDHHYRRLAAALALPWAWASVAGLTLSFQLHTIALAERLFWGGVVPGVFMLLVVAGHEPWRRACPLAFWSGLGQAWTRSIRGHRPPRRLAANSWLARHHLALQAALLWLGLAARLLVLHHSLAALAGLCLLAMAGAFLCGCLLPGRVWCHYLCPMGPVEEVVVGIRGFLGSRAHLLAKGIPGQSTCRTLHPDGSEANGCVHCQSPCFDIDAERSYWLHLQNRSALHHFAWCYPGLVLAFFWQLLLLSGGSPARLWAGHWASAQATGGHASSLLVPLLLLLGAGLSWLGLATLHRLGLSLHRTQVLARGSALTVLLLAVDPTFGLGGAGLSWALRLACLAALSLTLRRDWRRTPGHHSHEALAASLRRHGTQLSGERLLRAVAADVRHHATTWPEQAMAPLQHNHSQRSGADRQRET